MMRHDRRLGRTTALTLAAAAMLSALMDARAAAAQDAAAKTNSTPGGIGATQTPAVAPQGDAPRRPREIPITFPRVIAAETFSGPIERVVDGETLLVKRDLGGGRVRRETVRLYGLSRPEPSAAVSPDGSESARRYLNDNLRNKTVRVEGRGRTRDGALEAIVTESNPPRPRFLQPIRNTGASPDLPRGVDAAPPPIPTGETPLNVLLVRLGLARRDPALARTDEPMAKRLAEAEEGARKDRNGLWAAAATGTASSAALPPPVPASGGR